MAQNPGLSDHAVGLLMASTAALLWGLVSIGIKYALTFCHVETIIGMRFTISFLFLAGYYLLKAPHSFKIIRQPPLLGILAGIGLAGNYFGHTIGVNYTTPGNAQVLGQAAPLMLAAVGYVFFKEKLTRLQKAGFVLAAVGFSFFYRDQITSLVVSRAAHLHGDAWLLFSAVTWVVFASAQKILVRSWTPQQANLLIFGTAMLVFLPMADFSDLIGLDLIQWLTLAFLGANTLIAYGSLAVALKMIPTNQISVIVTLNPLVALIAIHFLSMLDLVWLSAESITLWGYLGAVVMLSGVILVVLRPNEPPRRKQRGIKRK